LIGLASLPVNGTHLSSLLHGMQDILAESERSVVVETHHDIPSQNAALDRLLHRRVEGIIATLAVTNKGATDHSVLKRALKSGIPAVEFFGHSMPDIPSVNLDNAGAARLLVEHLVKLGHRRIALLIHSAYTEAKQLKNLHFNAWEYYQGYLSAIRKAGLKPIIITHPTPSETGDQMMENQLFECGILSAKSIRTHSSKPTAVVCQSTITAAGLVFGCREHGISVPDQLSIAGMGDESAALTTQPALTVVRYDICELGRQAMKMMDALLRGEKVKSVKIPSTLIVRGSTTRNLICT
jgi:LacI family transcriptional regulator